MCPWWWKTVAVPRARLGANVVAKSPPDGQTWLFVFDTHGVNPSLQANMPFDTMKDLDPVMLIGKAPMVIVCHPSKPYQSFKDVIEASKTGPGINYGTIGNGSLGHLAMTLLAKASGAKLNHIPYRGGGPLVNDSIAGHIEISIASVPNFAQQIAGKMLRPLLQTGASRVSTLADTPTAAEMGFTGFDAPAWWAVFAPAGTPAPVVEKFRAALMATYNEPETRKRITESQQMQLVLSTPEELRTFLAGELARWGAVVRENNIKAD